MILVSAVYCWIVPLNFDCETSTTSTLYIFDSSMMGDILSRTKRKKGARTLSFWAAFRASARTADVFIDLYFRHFGIDCGEE
jgi:hypothetical protein